MHYKRIHIIGPSGSGKTELATRLSNLLGYPTFNLDHLAYADASEGNFKNPRSRAERLSAVEDYSKLPSWIAEGAYFSWVGRSFKNADIIVLLRPPCHIREHNLRKRHLSLSKNEENIRLNYLLEQNSSFDKLYDERIAGFIQLYHDKLKEFTGSGKAYKFFVRINKK